MTDNGVEEAGPTIEYIVPRITQKMVERLVESLDPKRPRSTYPSITEDMARIALSGEAGYSISKADVEQDCSVLAKHAIVVIQAAFQAGRKSLGEDVRDTLKPFAKAATEVEKAYGSDLPDHQLQFPEIQMVDLRRARNLWEGK
jgi:hypothetical protein